MRWSKTKLPLSEPATTRSDGSQWRRSAEREDLLERAPRATPAARTTGTHSHSASKWQSSVSVSRSAGPPHRGHSSCTNSVELRQRVARARRRDVQRQQHRQLLPGTGTAPQRLAVDDRDRRAPRALARDREVVGLVAHRRPRRRLAAGAVPSLARDARRSPTRRPSARCRAAPEPLRDHLVGAVLLGHPEHGGRAETPVDQPARCSTGRRGPPARAGSVRPVSTSGDHLGLARAALPAARAQLLELLATHRARTPTRRPPGAAARSARSARLLERVGVRREHGQRSRRPRPAAQLDLHAVDAAEHDLLAGQRDLVPDAARRRAPAGGGRSPAGTR